MLSYMKLHKLLPTIILLIIILLFSFQNVNNSDSNCKVLKKEISKTYKGECKKGLAHGFGLAIGTDTFEGNFKKGLPHGEGLYKWSTGEVYSGKWKKGLRHGMGKYSFKHNGKDSIQFGYWEKDKFTNKNNHNNENSQCSILYRRSIERVRFVRYGDGHKVEIKFTRMGGGNNDIRDLMLFGSSGTDRKFGSYIAFENVEFPFSANIRYKTKNKLNSVLLECELRFKIQQSGYWQVIISN